MEHTENIKRLEEANITLITDYLEDNYVILHNTFVNKHSNKSEWGYEIIEHLMDILSINEQFLTEVLKCWVVTKGMTEDKWQNSYMSKALNTIYKPDKLNELERIIGVNGEKQMVRILSDAICKEIDDEVLRLLKKKVTGIVEFGNLLNCIGYKFGIVTYSNLTFESRRQIISTTEYDKIYEQQNNPYWKDWFRARRQNEET